MINLEVLKQSHSFAEKFQRAVPYKHVCIEDFFNADMAELILKDFPAFDFTPKKNEFGDDGPKAVYENLSEISPFYEKLTAYLNSEEFNNAISQFTGIEGLRWGGESMYGGGTHENINGAELDPHVDFNYDDRTKEHRRINLLIYLNKEWEEGWGGEFELHSDPREPENNQIKSYLPLFNRAVIMETSEKSWHGFPLIKLPPGKENLSRKSLALYFYTKDRPQEEITGGHGTFYIQRPLPNSFQVGELISQDIFNEVKYLVFKRDELLRLHQQREIEASNRFVSLESNLFEIKSRLRVPILGWAKQVRQVEGFHHDDWLNKDFVGNFVSLKPLQSILIRFYVANIARLPMLVEFNVNDLKEVINVETDGMYELKAKIQLEENTNINISLNMSTAISGFEAGVNDDTRELSVILNAIVFE
jgi:hypothetical protein